MVKTLYKSRIIRNAIPVMASPTDAASMHLSLRSAGSRYFRPNLMASIVLGEGFLQIVFMSELSICSSSLLMNSENKILDVVLYSNNIHYIF